MIIERQSQQEFRNYIDRFWLTERKGNSGVRAYEIMPDANVDLLFEFSASGCNVLLYGPASCASLISINGGSEYFGVRFHQGKAPRLADAAAAELVDNSIMPTSLLGTDITALGERLYSCRSIDEKKLVFETLLRSAGACSPRGDNLADRAISLVQEHVGQVSVRETADHLGVGIRALERSFAEHIGLSPKKFIRITRFNHARTLLKNWHEGSRFSLAELASICGYADQSHLIKDFKAFTNKSPSEFLSSPPSHFYNTVSETM
jgi:AraC-like DNA-binding protein